MKSKKIFQRRRNEKMEGTETQNSIEDKTKVEKATMPT